MTVPTLAELLDKTQRSVTHLEMRDNYGLSSEGYRAWRAGVNIEEIARFDYLAPWVDLIGRHVARGVTFRRARVVSEPFSDYIRYEHAITPAANLAAGEQVRWLPRHRAYDLALPGCDFWQFDDGMVRLIFSSGDGELVGYEMTDDPAMVNLCSTAFEAVWERGIGHTEYNPA